MAKLTFTRTTERTAFIKALQRDYSCPKGSIWTAHTPLDETCVAFLNADGTGLILVSNDPEGYTKGSKALKKGKDIGDWTGCPSEWEIMKDEALDVSGDTFDITTSVSL